MPGLGLEPGQVVQRPAQHQQSVAAAGPGREPGHRRRVGLERVRGGEPALPEQHRAEKHRHHVDGDEQQQDRDRRAVRRHQLEVDEAEQTHRRRPHTHPPGQTVQTGPGVASEQARGDQVQAAERVQGAPHRSQEQRQRHQAHPHPDVDEPEDGVGQPVDPEQQRDQRPARHRQAEPPDRPPQQRCVDAPRSAAAAARRRRRARSGRSARRRRGRRRTPRVPPRHRRGPG